MTRLLQLYGIQRSTFYGWSEDQTVSPLTRRNILAVLPDEEKAVVDFRLLHRKIGCRKLAWLMNDTEVAALSESTVYKVRSKHDLLGPGQKSDTANTATEYQNEPL